MEIHKTLKSILNLNEERKSYCEDDIKVNRCYVEYDGNKGFKYMIYEMDVKDNDGSIRRIYKALKFVRVIRLPKNAKQSTAFMEMHEQILASIWDRGINFITIIANMIKPVALGLLFIYGIQGVADNIQEAKRMADNDYYGLTALLQGTYKVMEFRPLNHEEIEWLREKMYSMKHLSVVRGLPISRQGGNDTRTSGMGGTDMSPNSQDTTEEFITGMSDKEYVIEILSTPVDPTALRDWLTKTAKVMTTWYSQLQGSKGVNFGISIPMVYMANLGASSGWNHGYSDAENVGYAESHTEGATHTEGVSNSQGVANSTSAGKSIGVGQNLGISHQDSESASVSKGHNEGTNYSYSENESVNSGLSNNKSVSSNVSISENKGQGQTSSFGESSGIAHSESHASTESGGQSGGASNTGTNAHADGTSWNISGDAIIVKGGGGGSTTDSVANSNGKSATSNWSGGTNDSKSASDNYGQSSSMSNSVSQGAGISKGEGISEGIGTSQGLSNGKGESFGLSSGDSESISRGNGRSDGWSKGLSQTESLTMSQSTTTSQSTSQTVSNGSTISDGKTHSTGDSRGTNSGISGGVNQGTSATMGVGPSLSYSKTYQWLDQEVKNILMLLEFQNARLMKALNGNGAFFTDIYIATPDEFAKSSASALAKSTWYNENASVCPLQVLDLEEEEQKHMLYHFNSFSVDVAKERIEGDIESYRYSTILLPEEQTAFTHPPRISEGGVFADVNDIPKFAVPSMKKGEVFVGKIISGERWTPTWGYKTPFDFRLNADELMHAFFTGESRSGKTVCATRVVAEIANKFTKNGKRLRIVCMDPKKDWRVLAKFVEPERFKFYSLGSREFLPINLNICKIPKNVYPQQWVDGIIEIYCRAYGLGERGKSVLGETFFKLYEEANVFVDNWREVAPERSAKVTLPKIYDTMVQYKRDLENPNVSGKGKVGNDVRDAYARVLDRLQVFGRPFSLEYQLFGREDGIGIDELIGKDDVVVLESYGLETTFKNFIFGVITSGFFKYAQGFEDGFRSTDQYETILVIEEANEVLTGSGSNSKDSNSSPLGGQSEFEKILDQSAGLGLYIFSITQKIADMPSSITANSGLVFAGKISRTDDVTTVVRKIGREERYEDRDLTKWFPRSPIGWFVCRSSRNFDFKDVEPSLVAVEHLGVNPPTNAELLDIMARKEVLQNIKSKDILN